MVQIRKNLIENPIFGAIVIIILHYCFFLTSLLIYYYISYYLGLAFHDIQYITLVLLRFIIIFSLMGIFWIVIVPLGLKPPNENLAIKEYFEVIKLKRNDYIMQNIFLGLGCGSIYGFFYFFGFLRFL